MVNKKQILEKIIASKQEVLWAEKELDQLLDDTLGQKRAEKMVITNAVVKAISRVKAARQSLFDLESLITASDD